jgi:hypothetical protein
MSDAEADIIALGAITAVDRDDGQQVRKTAYTIGFA